MSEERLERMEIMIADLIRIVGHTNSIVEELKADVTVLKTDVAQLKADVAELKTGQETLKQEFYKFRLDVAERFANNENTLDFLKYKLNENEEQLFVLRKTAYQRAVGD